MIKIGIKNKPYHLLLYSAILLLLISFLVGTSVVELHLDDTYLITEMALFMQFSALILLFVWVIYLLTARFLHSKELTWIHVILTIAGTVIFITAIASGFTRIVTPDRNIIESSGFVIGATSPLLITLLGQLLYFVNLFQGLFKK